MIMKESHGEVRSKLSVENVEVRILRRTGFLRTARGLGPEWSV